MLIMSKEWILDLVPVDKRGQMDREIKVRTGETMILSETLYCGRLDVERGARLYLNRHNLYVAGPLTCHEGGLIDAGHPDDPPSSGGGGGTGGNEDVRTRSPGGGGCVPSFLTDPKESR
jgi:hypothetical protein